MIINNHEMGYFHRHYDKIKRHLACRSLEKKLAQQYQEIMHNRNSRTPRSLIPKKNRTLKIKSFKSESSI